MEQGSDDEDSDLEDSDMQDSDMHTSSRAHDHDDDEDIILRSSSYEPNDTLEKNRTRLNFPQTQLLTPFIKDASKTIEVREFCLKALKQKPTPLPHLQYSDRRQLVTKKKSFTHQSFQVRKAVSSVRDVDTVGDVLSGEMGCFGTMARIEGFGN